MTHPVAAERQVAPSPTAIPSRAKAMEAADVAFAWGLALVAFGLVVKALLSD